MIYDLCLGKKSTKQFYNTIKRYYRNQLKCYVIEKS